VSLYNRNKHVAIVGAGYAGLPCAFKLGQLLKHFHGHPASITLINTDPRQELSSELYRVLRNGKGEFYNFLPPLKKLGVRFVEGQVSAIRPNEKTLSIRGEIHQELKYDELVIASGFKGKVPPLEGLEAFLDAKANEQKNVFLFRNNVQAQQLRLALKRLGWSSETRFPKDVFVVILGAGVTGLEVAGELAHLRGSNSRARLVVVDQKTELLQSFSPIAKKILKKELARMRIETVLGSPAIRLNQRRELEIENGQVIPCDLLVVCTGGRPSTKILENFSDAASPMGLKVKGNLQIEGYPDHYAIGDIAHVQGAPLALGNRQMLLKTAQFAIQEGNFVAEHLFDKIIGNVPQSRRRFEATDLGFLVSLGPFNGFGRIGPEVSSTLGKFLSPFVVGPLIDTLKRGAKMRYLSSLKWDEVRARLPF